jgi:hypothetical protein
MISSPGFILDTSLARETKQVAMLLSMNDTTILKDRLIQLVIDLTNQDRAHADLAISILLAFPGLVSDFDNADGILRMDAYNYPPAPNFIIRSMKLSNIPSATRYENEWCDVTLSSPLESTLRAGKVSSVVGFIIPYGIGSSSTAADNTDDDDNIDSPSCVVIITSASQDDKEAITRLRGSKKIRIVLTNSNNGGSISRNRLNQVFPSLSKAFLDTSLGLLRLSFAIDLRDEVSYSSQQLDEQLNSDPTGKIWWSTIIIQSITDAPMNHRDSAVGSVGGASGIIYLNQTHSWPILADSIRSSIGFVICANLGLGITRGGIGNDPYDIRSGLFTTNWATRHPSVGLAHRSSLGWLSTSLTTTTTTTMDPLPVKRIDFSSKLDETLILVAHPRGSTGIKDFTSTVMLTNSMNKFEAVVGIFIPFGLGVYVAELVKINDDSMEDSLRVLVRRFFLQDGSALPTSLSSSDLVGELKPGDVFVSGPVSLSVASLPRAPLAPLSRVMVRVRFPGCTVSTECLMPTPLLGLSGDGNSDESFPGCIDDGSVTATSTAGTKVSLGWCFSVKTNNDKSTIPCTCTGDGGKILTNDDITSNSHVRDQDISALDEWRWNWPTVFGIGLPSVGLFIGGIALIYSWYLQRKRNGVVGVGNRGRLGGRLSIERVTSNSSDLLMSAQTPMSKNSSDGGLFSSTGTRDSDSTAPPHEYSSRERKLSTVDESTDETPAASPSLAQMRLAAVGSGTSSSTVVPTKSPTNSKALVLGDSTAAVVSGGVNAERKKGLYRRATSSKSESSAGASSDPST